MAYIEGKNRSEIRFKCLEEEISKDNEVRTCKINKEQRNEMQLL